MPTEDQPLDLSNLTDKRTRFIDEYLLDCNATQAALRAGYAASGARQEGSRLLANADIRTEIDRRLDAAGMPAKEVVKHLSDIAQSRLNDFFTLREVQGYEQQLVSLSELIERKEAEIDFTLQFLNREGLHSEEQQKPFMGKLTQLRQEALELLLEAELHGPDAVKLVPGKPVIRQVAELDLVKLAKAQQGGRLKSYSLGKDGMKVETYAADAALEKLARMHGLFEKDNEQTRPVVGEIGVTIRRSGEGKPSA